MSGREYLCPFPHAYIFNPMLDHLPNGNYLDSELWSEGAVVAILKTSQSAGKV